MQILLDEMYSGLKEYLEVLGWDVTTVQEQGLSGGKDREVVEHAKKEGLLLVTQDQKPSELCELLGVKHVFISNLIIAEIVDRQIRMKYES
jgi:predicted nuclease of predicted toxin-antitoxin system